MLKPMGATPATRVARVALMCVAASILIWVVLAMVATLSGTQSDFATSLLVPGTPAAAARILAITLVLAGVAFARFIHLRGVRKQAAALELERQRASEMYENSPDRIACMADDGAVIYTNLHETHADTPQAELEVPCYSLLYDRADACDDCAFEPAHEGVISESTQIETAPDGSVRWFSKTLYPVSRDDGTTDSVVEVARDVTDLHAAEAALLLSQVQLEAKIAERTAELTKTNRQLEEEIAAREQMSQALRESETRFRLLIDSSPDMIILHSEGRVDLVNRAGVLMLGAVGSEDIVGMKFAKLWDVNGVPPKANGSPGLPLGLTAQTDRVLGLVRLDGTRLDVEMTESLVMLDGRIHVQCIIRDVSEALRAREAINRMAYFDALTGLPNREQFADRLQTALAGVRRNDMLLAVAFIDIDEFSKVNDAWVHQVGDAVLTLFAERLQSLLREQDTVARYGSDEFAVLAELKSADEAAMFAKRIRSGLRPPFHVGDRQVGVTISLGIATTAGHGVRPEELVRRADEAMLAANHSGPDGYEISCMDTDANGLIHN